MDSSHALKSDSITSDLIIGIEREIKEDSIGYFSKLQYMADLKNNVKHQTLKPSEHEIKLLKEEPFKICYNYRQMIKSKRLLM
jgi:hypothetical protein